MTSFTDVLSNGSTIQPSQVSYAALSLSANTTTQWPLEAASSPTICALIMNVTPTASGFSLALPNATLASVGSTVLVVNKSMAFDFNLTDYDGNVITVIAAATAYLRLSDRQLDHGRNLGRSCLWRHVGAGQPGRARGRGPSGDRLVAQLLSAGDDARRGLDGCGLGGRAIHNNYTGGSGTMTLPAVATATNGFWFTVGNNGTGTLTATPQAGEFINGSATLAIGAGEMAGIVCSGGAWFTFSLSRSLLSTITRLSLTGLTGGTYTLTSLEAANALIYLSGTLVSNLTVVFPGSTGRWFMSNQCSGSYTVTCAVTGGDPGTTIPAAEQRIIMSNGTNMIPAMTTTPIAPTSFSAGLVGSPSIYLTSFVQTGLYFPTTSSMAFAAGGSEVFRMAASGLLINSQTLTDFQQQHPVGAHVHLRPSADPGLRAGDLDGRSLSLQGSVQGRRQARRDAA